MLKHIRLIILMTVANPYSEFFIFMLTFPTPNLPRRYRPPLSPNAAVVLEDIQPAVYSTDRD
jgi:hypothetical protein